VHYVAVHWYDWGSYSNTGNTAPDPNGVFTRFKNYINQVYAEYGKPIWITEFNANRNTTSATHEAFIALALPWLEAQPFVERYAYFFPPAWPPVDGSGNITNIGKAYRDFAASSPAITKNYDNAELLAEDVNVVFEGENAAIYNPGVANIVINCATASGGKMAAAVTGASQIGFNELNVPVSGNYKLQVGYFAKTTTGRNLTIRVNHGTPQVIVIPGSGNWCFEGGSPGLYAIPVNLLAGNNSIEFTESPIIDFIRIKEDGALPALLMTFNGLACNRSIDLTWRTAQEQNSRHFDVLKSTDGNHYIPIGQVKAAGNTHSPSNYLYTDNNPAHGMNFYKLKAVDGDGSFTYSKSVAVNYKTSSIGLTLVSSTPNNIRLSVNSDINEKASIALYGMDGKRLYSNTVVLNQGTNFIDIPAAMFQGSLGIVALYTGKNINTLKIAR
jgi:hypothetical protein